MLSVRPTFIGSLATRSLPALATRLRNLQRLPLANPALHNPATLNPALGRLVQAYTIHPHPQAAEEARAAFHVILHILDRMRRLASAFSEWQTFDVSAYFDLTHEQSSQLVHIEERVSTVYCTFFADPLLPSFQSAINYFEESFAPGYALRHSSGELAEHFFHTTQPTLVAHWLHLQQVLVQVRSELSMEIGFLAMNAAEEERWRYQQAWEIPPATGLNEKLLPPLRQIPSLTLSHEFPLPAYRQPGRRRRLWFNRERKRIWRKRRET